MACILQPECNFLHIFFRCHLPVEMVDVEVRITSIEGIHMFRIDRTCQIIKCNPWNTRLCTHPTIIKKMKIYLQLEEKLGPTLQPQTDQSRPAQPDINPCIRKETKAIEKKEEAYPHKEVQSKSSDQTWIQNQQCSCTATHNSSQCPNKFKKSKAFTRRYFRENLPPLKNIQNCAGTPWPKAGKMSGNLFKLRMDWPIPPTITTSKPPIKIELQIQEQAIPPGNSSTKSREVWMGTELPHLQKHGRRLGW